MGDTRSARIVIDWTSIDSGSESDDPEFDWAVRRDDGSRLSDSEIEALLTEIASRF